MCAAYQPKIFRLNFGFFFNFFFKFSPFSRKLFPLKSWSSLPGSSNTSALLWVLPSQMLAFHWEAFMVNLFLSYVASDFSRLDWQVW